MLHIYFHCTPGLAHLEGLEMVSNQCEGKVQSLLNSMPAEQVTEIKPDLIGIKDEFNLEEHEDDEAGLQCFIYDLYFVT